MNPCLVKNYFVLLKVPKINTFLKIFVNYKTGLEQNLGDNRIYEFHRDIYDSFLPTG